jgi:hypothetical protein
MQASNPSSTYLYTPAQAKQTSHSGKSTPSENDCHGAERPRLLRTCTKPTSQPPQPEYTRRACRSTTAVSAPCRFAVSPGVPDDLVFITRRIVDVPTLQRKAEAQRGAKLG